MFLEGNIKPIGAFTVKLFDKDGHLKEEREVKNVVVTVGKNFLAAWLAAASQSTYFMQYVMIGTGSTGATVGDTGLQSEISRKAGVVSSSTNVWQNTVTFNAGEGTGTIAEAGIVSAAAAGTLLARQTFTAVPKSATDVLVVTWQITLS